MSNDYRIARRDELAPGEMKSIEIDDDRSVLLVNVDGELYAYGPSCPHHGAPLANGDLIDRQIVCPWHLAHFQADTGRYIQPPTLDDLPRFDLRVEGDDVYVRLPDEPPGSCTPSMARRDTAADPRIFAIVGAGAAGATAAETLRIEGFQGRILLLTAEEEVPYDRTDLSKRFLRKPDAEISRLRSRDFYAEHDIELLTAQRVASLDPKARLITTDQQKEIRYDRALLATGSQARTLGVSGERLDNVLTLRRPGDARGILDAVEQGRPAAVVGAGFIGMEVAASLAERGMKVTVIAPESTPFARTLGEPVGQMYRSVHEEKGVEFCLGRTVQRFEGDGAVGRVILDNDEKVEAMLAVVGVGVQPATDFLHHVKPNGDGSVNVDEHLKIEGYDDLFAAGDIARFVDWRDGGRNRIEHWRVAAQQGRIAAMNMLDPVTPYREVPFFWTNQYMVIVDRLGSATDWDEVVVDGDLQGQDFIAWYLKDDRVRAVTCCNRSEAMIQINRVLKENPLPTLDELRNRIAAPV